ncbi:MAG TPA: ABC transporter ATP-binding protein [Paludibaculum sp.]|jgi:lipoprotein-releasing system ATP-binding protein
MIEAQGLTKRYRSGAAELSVLEDVSFTVHAGERIALTGESGTGKSTLLHLLGLLDAPTSGGVAIAGVSTSNLDERALATLRNKEIGFVWQMNTLLPEFTALENVMMPLLIRGVTRAEAAKAAQARLDEVELEARGHHLAGELSGGEQQRVVLARALVGKPRILLADEPTGNLDERTGAMIMDLIETMHNRHGLATLYVTHNPRFAARAGRVLALEGGRITLAGGGQ